MSALRTDACCEFGPILLPEHGGDDGRYNSVDLRSERFAVEVPQTSRTMPCLSIFAEGPPLRPDYVFRPTLGRG